MSVEEDTELRDLLVQALQENDALPKIKAELRASIYLTLSEDEFQKQSPLRNTKVKSALESREGQIMFCLVREFLEFYDLDFTISVYEPESYLGTAYQYQGRSKIIEDLGTLQLNENSTLPLLLQLIQMAQSSSVAQSSRNININLKVQNESVEELGDGKGLKSVEEKKDKSTTSTSEELEPSSKQTFKSAPNPVIAVQAVSETNLNETFNLSSPTIHLNDAQKSEASSDKQSSPHSLESSKSSEDKDSSYEAEDSVKDVPLIDLDKSAQNSDKSTQSSEKSISETEFSPPILKDSKSHSKFDMTFDKLKLSPQKTEKLKAKSSLSSLADLPPLPLNKSRNDTLLLPSLYSKEFKEKSNSQNLKEIDKFFDVDVDSLDNYEEDFMSETEMNLNKNLDSTRNTLVDESSTDSNKNITSVSIRSAETNLSKKSARSNNSINSEKYSNQNSAKYSDRSSRQVSNQNSNQSSEKLSNQNSQKNKTDLSPRNVKNSSGTSSIASDDLNLNIDDILNSPTSN